MPNSRVILLADTRSNRAEWEMLIGHQIGTRPIVFQEAWSAETALAIARRMHPDLVITELLGVDYGLWLIRNLREIVPHPHIVVVSASSDGDIMRNALEAGAQEYITKPFDRNRFVGIVRSQLDL